MLHLILVILAVLGRCSCLLSSYSRSVVVLEVLLDKIFTVLTLTSELGQTTEGGGDKKDRNNSEVT